MKKIFTLIGLLLITLSSFAGGSQPGNWRWRNDDGSTVSPEAGGATWAADLNTPISIHYDETSKIFRLRLQLNQAALPDATDGQIFLQYMDGGLAYNSGGYVQTSGNNWEPNPLTGKPQPTVSNRGAGNSASDNDASSTTASGNSASGGTGSPWITIPNSNNTAPIMNTGSTTNSGSSSLFIMAASSNVVDQQERSVISNNSYATYRTVSSSNNVNLLGRPDYLDYSYYYANNTRWGSPTEFSTTNGVSVANRSNTSQTTPTVLEFEFALKLNSNMTAANRKNMSGHRLFFRIRSHGTSGGSTGFSSPEGTGHYTTTYGPYDNSNYSSGSNYVENTLRRRTFTYSTTSTTYVYDNKWPAYLNNNPGTTSSTVTSNPNNGNRYESNALVLSGTSEGTWVSGNYYSGASNSDMRKSIVSGSMMTNTVAQQNSIDYRASAPYAYLDILPFALPVDYAQDLAASVNGSIVNLSWTTAQEINNKEFEVQRSTDGSNFTTIATVSSKAANGNSSAPVDYTYPDASPASGKNFYRLKQVDLDGTSAYSSIASVTVTSGSILSSILYPNPAISSISISNVQVGTIYKVINAGGQIVSSGITTSTIQSIPISGLASGIYFVQAYTSLDGLKTFKFRKK